MTQIGKTHIFFQWNLQFKMSHSEKMHLEVEREKSGREIGSELKEQSPGLEIEYHALMPINKLPFDFNH